MAISGTLTETAVERADALRRAPASDEAEAAMAETEVAAARAAICTCLFVRRIEVMQGSECRIEGDGSLEEFRQQCGHRGEGEEFVCGEKRWITQMRIRWRIASRSTRSVHKALITGVWMDG